MLPQTPRHEQPVLGCDVSAKTVTVFDSLTGEITDIANTPRSLRAMLARRPDHIISMEVTGGYEAALADLSHQAGHTTYRIHPNRVSAFIRAKGQQAKTDPLDARAITAFTAQYKDSLHPYTPPTPEEKACIQLSRRRDELVRMRTAETNRLKAPDYAACRASIRLMMKTLTQEITKIDARIAALIAKDERLRCREHILRAIPGIGAVTAHSLIALLPELGRLPGKQIAALSGLAPYARQSGTKDGYRRTGRGRTDVKRILFMAALSASRYNPVIKDFYQRLIQNGKKPMVALIACARKLIVIANAKVRDMEKLKQS